MKVAIIGASGLVGGRLYERLQNMEGVTARAIVHSSGNVWNLARKLEPLVFADLLDPETLKPALEGCTHVVNCSRGNQQVMLEGLDNIIAGCRAAGVQRLIHLSSVTVYGGSRPAAELTEDEPVSAASGYAEMKIRQDDKVMDAGRKGIETVILCPPNIAGYASRFMEDVWATLCEGRFGLVDEGRRPYNAVDVDNLCHAIELALRVESVARPRYFITDGADAGWGDLVRELERLSGRTFETVPIDEQQLRSVTGEVRPRGSILKSIKHLVSSDVRMALRGDPLLARADKQVRSLIARLPGGLESGLRRSIEGTVRVPPADVQPRVDWALARHQLVRYRYSIANARRDLGYEPVYSWRDSTRRFVQWRAEYSDHLSGYEDLFEDLAPGSAFVGH